MRYLPNGAQMKAADTYTIEKVGIPSLVLMERAALETVRVLKDRGVDFSDTLVVCGSGNNGGDGFAAARILKEYGFCAEVLFVGQDASMSEECRTQKQIAERLGISVFTDFPKKEYTVIIDAVFGVGLSRAIEGRYHTVIEWMNDKKCEKAAIDIPSGICAESGRVLGIAFRADITVSMECVKLGCELFPGKLYAGETVSVPIGIDLSFFEKNKDVCITYDPEDIPLLLPKRAADSHKGDYGKILMITGSKGMAGAAYLSAKAAYAVGAGLVQIYTAEENRTVLQELLPEAIISCYNETAGDYGKILMITGSKGMAGAAYLSAKAAYAVGAGLVQIYTAEENRTVLQELLPEAIISCYNETAGKPDDKELEKLIQWADVICIGCGLGTSVFASRLLKKTMEILRENGSEEEKLRSCPCIIDADGLNLLSMDMEQLQGVPNVILTPHMKEMSRLINKEIPQIAECRFSVVKEFTEQYQVVCALKDSRTVVMKEGHHPFLNLAGNSAMAKAGSGDVLAGMISGLAAQKTDIFDAVSAGVYFHACGGDEARKKKGSYSVLARDLIDGIGQCLKNAEERL